MDVVFAMLLHPFILTCLIIMFGAIGVVASIDHNNRKK